MTVDELIKLWREYREDDHIVSFDDFINWLERRDK